LNNFSSLLKEEEKIEHFTAPSGILGKAVKPPVVVYGSDFISKNASLQINQINNIPKVIHYIAVTGLVRRIYSDNYQYHLDRAKEWNAIMNRGVSPSDSTMIVIWTKEEIVELVNSIYRPVYLSLSHPLSLYYYSAYVILYHFGGAIVKPTLKPKSIFWHTLFDNYPTLDIIETVFISEVGKEYASRCKTVPVVMVTNKQNLSLQKLLSYITTRTQSEFRSPYDVEWTYGCYVSDILLNDNAQILSPHVLRYMIEL